MVMRVFPIYIMVIATAVFLTYKLHWWVWVVAIISLPLGFLLSYPGLWLMGKLTEASFPQAQRANPNLTKDEYMRPEGTLMEHLIVLTALSIVSSFVGYRVYTIRQARLSHHQQAQQCCAAAQDRSRDFTSASNHLETH